jgi:hypothetical protein
MTITHRGSMANRDRNQAFDLFLAIIDPDGFSTIGNSAERSNFSSDRMSNCEAYADQLI